MGLCIDIGHTARLGIDPASEIRKFFPRVFDIHMKDVSAAVSEGKTCVMGLGVIDIPEMIKVLVKNKYAYTLALEYEAEAQDPLAGMARSFGYVQGIGAAMGYRIV
jgi:sugar phosphate isomerase/epimerase